LDRRFEIYGQAPPWAIKFKIGRLEKALVRYTRYGLIGTALTGAALNTYLGLPTVFSSKRGRYHGEFHPTPEEKMVFRKTIRKRKRMNRKGFRARKRVKTTVKATPSKYHEVKKTYRKPRFTRRKSRYMKFARKVRNIMANVTALKSGFLNFTGSHNAASGAQGVHSFLMGGGGLANFDDLFKILNSIDAGAERNVTLKLKSMEMTIEYTNDAPKQTALGYVIGGTVPDIPYWTGDTNGTGLPIEPNYCYIKAYHVVARRDMDAANGSDLTSFFTNTLALENTLGGALANAVNQNFLGVTPFEAPQFCSEWKVLDIKEGYIAPGQSFKLKLRKSKSSFIQGNRLMTNAFLKGITEGWLVIVHGAPNYGTGDSGTVALKYNERHKYHYHHILDDDYAIGHQ